MIDRGWGGTAVIEGVAAALALGGLAAWCWGEWSLRTDEVVGANIGAGLLIMLGWGLLGAALVTGVVGVIADRVPQPHR